MKRILLSAAFVLLCTIAVSACGENQTHPTHADYDAGVPAALACVPNLDGTIEASEIQPAVGIPLSYLVSPSGVTRDVDVAGKVDGDGHLVWDFSVDYANDQIARIQAQDLAGKWYASSFPSNAFVVAQDAGDRLEGVIIFDSSGYHLCGLASTDENPPEGKTLYVYDTPVDVYRFPLTSGLSYESVGTVQNATLRGLPYAGTDTYDIKVDGAGTLELPDYTFTQALRVRTTLTATPAAGTAVTTRQVGFLFECFGEVARATSQTNETNDDFTTAAEVRRLGLSP
ncbi:MAG TPA: hypothetical protein VF407_17525 [Polyangiaceae bacterium]